MHSSEVSKHTLLTCIQSAEIVLHIQEEINLHIDFCKGYGLSIEDIEGQEEDQGMCTIQRTCT